MTASLLQLVLDKSLTALPQRPADGAFVLKTKEGGADKATARVFKLNATLIDPILIERYLELAE